MPHTRRGYADAPPQTHAAPTHTELGFYSGLTHLQLRQHRPVLPVPRPRRPPRPAPFPQPLPPTRPFGQAPRWGLCLHLTPGVQHEVAMQLPEAVEGILALRAVEGALLVLVLLVPPPRRPALPSPRWLLLFLPEGPAIGGWRVLGGCSRAAEPAGWGARGGFPKRRAATELAGLSWGPRGLGCTGGPAGRATPAPAQALLHLVARVVLRVVGGLLLLLFLVFLLVGVRL